MSKERDWQRRQWLEGRCPRCGMTRDQVYAECSICRGKRQAVHQRYNRKRRSLAFKIGPTVYVEPR